MPGPGVSIPSGSHRRLSAVSEAHASPYWRTHLFDILTSSAGPGPDAAFTQQMLARNRRFFEQARAPAARATRAPTEIAPAPVCVGPNRAH